MICFQGVKKDGRVLAEENGLAREREGGEGGGRVLNQVGFCGGWGLGR